MIFLIFFSVTGINIRLVLKTFLNDLYINNANVTLKNCTNVG